MSKPCIDYAMSVINHTAQTMTSLQVAEITGRQHSNVMRDIRNLLEQLEDKQQFSFELSFSIRELPNGGSKKEPFYILTKKDCLLLASGYDANLRAKIINRWEELEKQHMGSPFATPSNPQLAYVQTQLYLADALADRLRLNDASRLGMYQSIAAPYNLALPQYVESKGVTKSVRDLLKEIDSPMSAVKFNMLLVEQGYLETMSRPTSGGKVRQFKNITEKGLAYGENLENPKNQKETQPHWYVDKFRELYNLVVA